MKWLGLTSCILCDRKNFYRNVASSGLSESHSKHISGYFMVALKWRLCKKTVIYGSFKANFLFWGTAAFLGEVKVFGSNTTAHLLKIRDAESLYYNLFPGFHGETGLAGLAAHALGYDDIDLGVLLCVEHGSFQSSVLPL